MKTDHREESSSDRKIQPINEQVIVGDPRKQELLAAVAVAIETHYEATGGMPTAIVFCVVDEEGLGTSNWCVTGEAERAASLYATRALFLLQHDLFDYENSHG